MITGMNFIGSTKSAHGEVVFSTFNPKTNTHTPWKFTEAVKEEIDQAAMLAEQAFSVFRETTPNKRAQFLRAIAEEIEALGDELIQTYLLETGLAQGRAIGERGRTVGQLKAFADLLDDGTYVNAIIETANPNNSPPKLDIRTMSVPLGPLVVFGSSNFPLAFSTAGGDTASALAAGCPVIVKCHPFHAGTSELVAGAILNAAESTSMPEGVFSHLFSKDHWVGTSLVSHPSIKAVGFTGSFNGGSALNKIAQQRKEPIPFFAEMGSINPVILLPSALKMDFKMWAEQLAGSIMLGAGQFCTNPGLILSIKGNPLEKFIEALGQNLSAMEPECMLHPSIYDQYQLKQYNFSSHQHVSVVSETSASDANHAKQTLLKINGDEFLENSKLHQEVFGPLSLVVVCENKKQLIQVIEQLEGQLTGTIIGSKDESGASVDVISALKDKVGRLIFNGVPTGVEVNPAMHHGGPYPATTDSRFTSVGGQAIQRWLRPLCFQNWPDDTLPEPLKNDNPLNIYRQVNSKLTKDPIKSTS